MNSTPNQTKTDPQAPSQTPLTTIEPQTSEPAQNVTSSPSTPLENLSSLTSTGIPIASVINTTTAPPVKPPISPFPVVLHSENNHSKSDKFPLVVAGLFLLVTVVGFGGSVVYFGFINKPSKKIATNLPIVSPPPVSVPSPTIKPPENIFITPSVSFRNLFSSDVFASDNPFDETTNPFTGITENKTQDSDAYQNPFEGQQ